MGAKKQATKPTLTEITSQIQLLSARDRAMLRRQIQEQIRVSQSEEKMYKLWAKSIPRLSWKEGEESAIRKQKIRNEKLIQQWLKTLLRMVT